MKKKTSQSLDLAQANDFRFTVTGNVAVHHSLKILRAANGDIRGFKTADGMTLLPVLAFEVTGKGVLKPTVISTDTAMARCGLSVTDYDQTEFIGGEASTDDGQPENLEEK